MKINILKVLSITILVVSFWSGAQGTDEEKDKSGGTPHQTNMQSDSDKDTSNLPLSRPVNFQGFQSYWSQFMLSPTKALCDFVSNTWNNPNASVASTTAAWGFILVTFYLGARLKLSMLSGTTPQTHPWLYDYRM